MRFKVEGVTQNKILGNKVREKVTLFFKKYLRIYEIFAFDKMFKPYQIHLHPCWSVSSLKVYYTKVFQFLTENH